MVTSKIINLLSNPRNISTALMYSFAQRPDTKVMDEPFYAYYLNLVPVNHPGREEVLGSLPLDLPEILNSIKSEANKADFVFIKNMAHHLIRMDWDFMLDFQNVLYIRDPALIISSFAKVYDQPTMADIGLEQQVRLFEFLLEKTGQPPIVLDSGELVKNPRQVLAELCKSLGMKFDEKMLHWSAGPRPEDGVWAKYWYKNVHGSTGFETGIKESPELPEHYLDLYAAAMPLYQFLFKHSILAK